MEDKLVSSNSPSSFIGDIGSMLSPYAGLAKFGLGFLGGMHDRQADYDRYANDESNIANKYLPFEEGGQNSFDLFNHYNNLLLGNPTYLQDSISAHYQNSPYQQTLMNNVRHQVDTNNAETGQLESSSGNSQLDNALAGEQNQFMQNYINQGLDEFNRGLGNEYNAANLGLGALSGYGRYADAAAQARFAGSNQSPGGFIGGLVSGIGSIL